MPTINMVKMTSLKSSAKLICISCLLCEYCVAP